MTRHVVITGAASGLGLAIAEAFARDSDTRLTLVDVDEERLAHTPTPGARITADLTDPEVPSPVVAQAWQTEPVDVLVNAAGIYPSIDMADVDADSWDRVFDLNVRAPVLTTAAFAAQAGDRGGVIVNISSGAALRARPGGGPYASSKAALEMATRAAALELGPRGIRVNAVSPGFVAVGSSCNPVSDEYAAAVSANPLGRPGRPDDVARAVHWIAGADAGWITGEVLRIDGGSATGAMHLPRLRPATGDSPDDEQAANDQKGR